MDGLSFTLSFSGVYKWFAFFKPFLTTPAHWGRWYQKKLPHCHSGNASWPNCAQKQYINTRERKKRSLHIIYSRATPLIYIVMNREKEEEAPMLYYGKGRVGTTVNDKVSWTFPFSY